jgi:hypothetical protein
MVRSTRVLISTAIASGIARHVVLVIFGYTTFFIIFFAPVLFSARVLAPGDGLNYFLPSYYAQTFLWDPSIWGGFPAMADAPRMSWYPPALFLALVPRSWEMFVVFAYVLGAGLTYGYVYSLTRSRLGAALSGFTYSMCGFMIAHLGHTAIVHTVAWLPLIVWALTELAHAKGRRRSFWFTTGALAVACAALAGHAQMLMYVIALSVICALVTGWRATVGRSRYYIACALVMLFGIGIAGLQLVPTAELTRLSLRAQLTFGDFVAFGLPLRQLPMLVFPYVYGGAPDSFYGTPYFGAWPSSADAWGATELTGYAGLLPLLLACVGLVVNRRRRVAWFWAAVAVIAVLLALGEGTPLARLTYQLPVFNKFRAPARYLYAFAFAVSVLAGLGVGAIQRQTVSTRLLRRVLAGAAVVFTLCILALKLFAAKIDELALQQIGQSISLNPLSNPALAVPLLIFLAAGVALIYWQRRPLSPLRGALLLAVLLFDLSSFAWFYEWRYRSPSKAYLNAPAAASMYRAQLDAAHQRLLPVRGVNGRLSELPPNLSQFWQLPSASGHGPFILARTSGLLMMQPDGSVDDSWRQSTNQSLDLMAVRYLVVPPAQVNPAATTDERGVRWSTDDFAIDIGPGCSPGNPPSFKIDLPQSVRATSVALVGALACSVEIPDLQEVLRLTMTDETGASITHALRAGRDFSEWAHDCTDVLPTMQHGRAQVFRTYQANRDGVRCEGHDYVARLRLDLMKPLTPGGSNNVRHIELHWTSPIAATFTLKKITLFDDDARTTTPVNPVAGSLNDTSRWRYAGEIDAGNSGYGPDVKAEDVGAARVYENLRTRPRVWLVPQVFTVRADEAVAAVRTSRLPDGSTFDPARTALIEESAPFTAQPQDMSALANAQVRVRLVTSNVMEVETETRGPAFLVTSDVYYPGWDASVDGTPTHIYQTNYVLRGVAVPAGRHVVRFEFRPRSLLYGAGISAFSLLLLVGFAFWHARQRN